MSDVIQVSGQKEAKPSFVSILGAGKLNNPLAHVSVDGVLNSQMSIRPIPTGLLNIAPQLIKSVYAWVLLGSHWQGSVLLIWLLIF